MFDSKSKCSKTSCIIVKICWKGCLFFIYYISTASKWILCKVFWQVLRPSVRVCGPKSLQTKFTDMKIICFPSKNIFMIFFQGHIQKGN